VKVKKFERYENYVNLQKEKTSDPLRRQKWIENFAHNTQVFKNAFLPYSDLIQYDKITGAVCLGARMGEEVAALRELGITDAIGIDLVPYEDLVIEGDIHNLPLEDESVDFVYTNIFDHVLDIDKFFREITRILTPGGKSFIQLQIGNDLDKYGVLYIGPEGYNFYNNFIKGKYELLRLLEETPKYQTPHNHSLNWNVFLEKEHPYV